MKANSFNEIAKTMVEDGKFEGTIELNPIYNVNININKMEDDEGEKIYEICKTNFADFSEINNLTERNDDSTLVVRTKGENNHICFIKETDVSVTHIYVSNINTFHPYQYKGVLRLKMKTEEGVEIIYYSILLHLIEK